MFRYRAGQMTGLPMFSYRAGQRLSFQCFGTGLVKKWVSYALVQGWSNTGFERFRYRMGRILGFLYFCTRLVKTGFTTFWYRACTQGTSAESYESTRQKTTTKQGERYHAQYTGRPDHIHRTVADPITCAEHWQIRSHAQDTGRPAHIRRTLADPITCTHICHPLSRGGRERTKMCVRTRKKTRSVRAPVRHALMSFQGEDGKEEIACQNKEGT